MVRYADGDVYRGLLLAHRVQHAHNRQLVKDRVVYRRVRGERRTVTPSIRVSPMRENRNPNGSIYTVLLRSVRGRDRDVRLDGLLQGGP